MFQRKRDSRMLVELLFQASQMYANRLPASGLELGDYGDVSKKTGEFIKSGNIIQEHPELKKVLGEGTPAPEDRKYLFASRSEGTAQSFDVGASIPALADCSIKLGWNISKDRHAALIMIDPILHEFNFEGRLCTFIKEQRSDLREKAFVTKLYKCSTYALLLTDGQAGQIWVGFNASAPLPTGIPVEVSAGTENAWKIQNQLGSWTTGKYTPGQHLYMPLATLRQVTPEIPALGWRGALHPPLKDLDKGMVDFYPPWDALNEDGSVFESDGPDSTEDEV